MPESCTLPLNKIVHFWAPFPRACTDGSDMWHDPLCQISPKLPRTELNAAACVSCSAGSNNIINEIIWSNTKESIVLSDKQKIAADLSNQKATIITNKMRWILTLCTYHRAPNASIYYIAWNHKWCKTKSSQKLTASHWENISAWSWMHAYTYMPTAQLPHSHTDKRAA